MRGEDDLFAQLLVDHEVLALTREESGHALGRDDAGDVLRIPARAALFQRLGVDVGGEDQYLAVARVGRHLLDHQHAQRVGLFAAGARRYPDAEFGVDVGRTHHRRDDLALQRSPCVGVAEEGGHADQQVLAQGGHFACRVAQQFVVVGDARDAGQAHAPAHAPQQHRLLVAAKVLTGAHAQQRDQVRQRVVVRRRQRVARAAVMKTRVPGIFEQRARHLLDRQDQVDQFGGDGIARHVVVLGRVGVLRYYQPTFGLDVAQSAAAVGPHAGQHDGDRLLLALGGERAEEAVDRQRGMRRLGPELAEAQFARADFQRPVRRDHIHVVAPQRLGLVGHLHDRHRRVPRQQIRQMAATRGCKMHDDDEGEALIGRHRVEEAAQRRESAGRGTDRDDRETSRVGRICRAIGSGNRHERSPREPVAAPTAQMRGLQPGSSE